jgi:hypothetical protein
MENHGRIVLAIVVAFVLSAAVIGAGIFLLVQRQTGTRASATVRECRTTGSRRYATTHCTGTWIAGGSLLDGGHVVFGSIDGADNSDVGKTIDVTLRGDTAYTRGLTLPLLLIALGILPGAAAALRARSLIRARR